MQVKLSSSIWCCLSESGFSLDEMVVQLKELFEEDTFDCCIHEGLMEHFPDDEIQEFVKQQLLVAPLIVCSVPVLEDKNQEIKNDGIYRNMKTHKQWYPVQKKPCFLPHHWLRSVRRFFDHCIKAEGCWQVLILQSHPEDS